MYLTPCFPLTHPCMPKIRISASCNDYSTCSEEGSYLVFHYPLGRNPLPWKTWTNRLHGIGRKSSPCSAGGMTPCPSVFSQMSCYVRYFLSMQEESNRRRPMEWMKFMRVSKRWYEVLMGHHRIWSIIHIYPPGEMNRLFKQIHLLPGCAFVHRVHLL